MVVLAVYIVTFVVGFPANVFTFVTLLRKARRRVSPSDILLLNLTAADLLLLLLLPFKMVEAASGMTWPLPLTLCPVANFWFYSSIYLSSLFLAALSVERYIGVVFPLRYKNRKRPARAMVASVFLWLVACSHCTIVFVAQYYDGQSSPATNTSTGSSSQSSTANGLEGGGLKMTNPGGLEPEGLTMANPGGLEPEGLTMANPGGLEPKGLTMANPGGLEPEGLTMANPGGFNPNSFTSSKPKYYGRGRSKISSPNTVNPEVSKISNPKGFVDDGSKIANHNISIGPGSRIPNPCSPKTSHSNISIGSRISNPCSPKTSKPNVFLSKPSTPNGTNSQDPSGPTDVSQPSSVLRSSSPSVRNGSTTNTTCYLEFSNDQLKFVLPLRLELFLVLFLLPFTITIFCYVSFVRVLLSRPNIPLEKKQRAVGLAVATMVNFGVCFAPYNISHVVGFVQKKSPEWRVYALLLTSLNAALDPVIIYFSSTAVQRAVAGVAVAMGDKLRVAGGWWRGTCSPAASQNESEGTLT